MFETLSVAQPTGLSAWHSASLLVIGLLNAAVGVAILRGRRSSTAKPVFVALLGIALWTTSQGVLLETTSGSAAFALNTTMHFGSLLAVTGAFHFALSYAGRSDWLRPGRLGVVYGIAGTWGLLLLTNPFHEWLYVHESHAGALVPVRELLEPLYFVHLSFTYTLTAVATVFFILEYLDAERGSVYAKQAGLIVFALFVPFFPNVLVFGGVTEINYSHWAFGATGLLIATSLYRYQWLDLVPVGRDQVIEQVRDGYLVVDSEWRIVDCNPAAREFLGIGDPVGAPVSDIFPDCLPLLRGEETEQQLSLDSAVVTVTASPVTTDTGDGFLLMLRDITEQRRAEKRFQALIENVSDVITVADTDGTVSYISPSVTDVSGYDPSELIGEEIFDYVHPEDRADAAAEFADLVSASGSEVRFEYRFRHKDGSWGIFEGIATNPQSDDIVDGVVIVSRDVTERKERERELEQSNQKLEQFAGLVSHDLRNPLNVIAGRAELARETGDDSHIDQIEQATERMSAMIDDLLVLSRAGQTVDDPETVSLAAAATEAWETVKTDDVELDVTVGSNVSVEADRTRLLNVFENLYRNAIEHGFNGATEHRQIRVGTISESMNGTEQMTGFYISDTGTGIPEAEREDIFEHGYTTNSDGTGFGLSIVGDIVVAHGWEISVTESDAGGARFDIEIAPGGDA